MRGDWKKNGYPELHIDDSDRWILSEAVWFIVGKGRYRYVQASSTGGKYARKLLHRVILDAKEGEVVDHINGDGLDNRRSNLRIVTHAMNMQNRHGAHKHSTTGIRGVIYNRTENTYRASVTINGVVHRKRFGSIEDAAAYVEQFRQLNMPGYVPNQS